MKAGKPGAGQVRILDRLVEGIDCLIEFAAEQRRGAFLHTEHSRLGGGKYGLRHCNDEADCECQSPHTVKSSYTGLNHIV